MTRFYRDEWLARLVADLASAPGDTESLASILVRIESVREAVGEALASEVEAALVRTWGDLEQVLAVSLQDGPCLMLPGELKSVTAASVTDLGRRLTAYVEAQPTIEAALQDIVADWSSHLPAAEREYVELLIQHGSASEATEALLDAARRGGAALEELGSQVRVVANDAFPRGSRR